MVTSTTEGSKMNKAYIVAREIEAAAREAGLELESESTVHPSNTVIHSNNGVSEVLTRFRPSTGLYTTYVFPSHKVQWQPSGKATTDNYALAVADHAEAARAVLRGVVAAT
jgi:hypothetical protein